MMMLNKKIILNRIEHMRENKKFEPGGRGRVENVERMKVREMIHDLFALSCDTFTHILGLLSFF